MDRHRFIEEESDARSRSIGRRNLRAKLREQLRGYSNVRGFPLDSDDEVVKATERSDSLSTRRESMRRRTSSVTRQQEYESDAPEEKYRPRARKAKESLVVPRLLWLTVYTALCYTAYKGIQYFTSEPRTSMCEMCSTTQCGILDEEFVFPIDDVPEIPFGTFFHKHSKLQCRADMCVPNEVVDPKGFCRVVNDVALLYKTRRLLTISGTPEEKSARFAEYFRSRSLKEDNSLAVSPTPSLTPRVPPAEPPKQPDKPKDPPKEAPTPSQTAVPPSPDKTLTPPAPAPQSTPPAQAPRPSAAPAPGPMASNSLSSGAFYTNPAIPVIDFRTLPASAGVPGGACNTLVFAPMDGDGYANLTVDYFKIYSYVSNYGQCCGLCWNDPSCSGWVRVAGGDATVLNCYLSKTVASDPRLQVGGNNPFEYNWQPQHMRPDIYDPNLYVRYTGNVPIMFEAGAVRYTLPDVLWGCPYPPGAGGSCPIPAGCNCGGGSCYKDGCVSPGGKTRLDPMYAPYRANSQL